MKNCLKSKKAIRGSLTVEASIAVPVYIIAAALIVSYFNAYFVMIRFNRCLYQASHSLILDYADYSLFKGIAEDAIKKEILKGRFSQELIKAMDQRDITANVSDIVIDFSQLFRFGENEGYLKCDFKISGIGFTKSIFLKAIGSGEQKDVHHDDVWSLEPMLRGRILVKRFGGNMPPFFELISRFINNEACVIKTLDPDAASYTQASEITKRMLSYIKRLYEYTEDINGEMIHAKKFLLIIPTDARNLFLAEQIEILRDECVTYGIEFECIRYGSLYK